MARVKGGTTARARRKGILKAASGYFGSKHRLWKTAKEQLLHSGVYAFRDRRQKKRDFRKLWITRINAACRENEISYSRFMNGLTKAGLAINRKMLSEVAIDSPTAFKDLVVIAKEALEGKTYKPSKVTIKAEAKKEVKEEPKVEVKEEPKAKKEAVKKTTTKKEEKVAEKPVKKATAKKTTTKKTAK
jgi:large subunit ribosomal protein L20